MGSTSERDKMPLYISLLRLCSGCTRNVQGELPATPRVAVCLIVTFKRPTSLGVGFLNRNTNPHQFLWYNLDSYISTALTPTAGSVFLVFTFACSKARLWDVKELIFGFVPHRSEVLCAAFGLQAPSCLPSSEARLSPACLREGEICWVVSVLNPV